MLSDILGDNPVIHRRKFHSREALSGSELVFWEEEVSRDFLPKLAIFYLHSNGFLNQLKHYFVLCQ